MSNAETLIKTLACDLCFVKGCFELKSDMTGALCHMHLAKWDAICSAGQYAINYEMYNEFLKEQAIHHE